MAMDVPVLHAERRSEIGSGAVRKLRRAGKVPAILYGHKQETIPLSLDPKEIQAAAHGGAHMVQVQFNGQNESALIREIQYDTFQKSILHVDLFRVSMTEEVVVSVPVELRGTPSAVASGAVLEHEIRELEVRCQASKVPETIVVNIRDMEVGDHIRVGDLELPEGVEAERDAEAVVVTLLPPRRAEEIEEAAAAEAAAAAPSEPEVIKRESASEKEEEK